MFQLHQSNRLDLLARSLIENLRGAQGVSPLQAIPVLVQNPGMKRWLQQRLASETGIAAGLEFPLPSRFVWSLHESLFGETGALQAWSEGRLRWRLMRRMREMADSEALRGLRPWLKGDNEALRRLQLAQKLASLFEQYQVYRPDMIEAWQRGRELGLPSEDWQAELWRGLCHEQTHEPHHRLLQRLMERLQQDGDMPGLSDVHVFALSSLSPVYLRLLMLLGERVDVHLYHLNPCAHYWGDIRERKEQQEGSLGEQLLAAMGRQGREFLDQFYDLDPNVRDDQRFEDIEADHLLGRVQQQILQLQKPEGPNVGRQDDSLCIVSCYSEWRELQVLRDRLLGWLDDEDGLQAHDIVVMCPDIDRIAPIIEAVFSEPVTTADGRTTRLPFSISDRSQGRLSALLPTLIEWVDLPDSRFTASEILAWLELPALQRRYDLDEEDLEQLRYWVRAHHVHWGRDGEHKREYGLEAHSLHSWRAAIDRLLASYLLDDGQRMLGELPLSEILPGQEDLQRLGRLKRLLDDLWRQRARFGEPTDLQGWQQRIHDLVDALLAPDEDDEWQLKSLRDALAVWVEDARDAGFDEKLDGEILRHLMLQHLDETRSQHRYLDGGITFCNLIPMRMLPFRVVCLLGMNENDFPRRDSQLRFDLLARKRRPGDRSSRDDDRFLFLQALMSARDHFYISYLGRDRRDDSERQPSVLVSQLIDSIRNSEGLEFEVSQAPLQAFSALNFDSEKGPSGGSFAEHWRVGKEQESLRPFIEQPLEVEDEDTSDIVELRQLMDFLRNPSRYFLRQGLGMQLRRDDYELEDDEPFDLNGLSAYRLRQAWIDAALEAQDPQQTERRLRNEGLLPPGNLGYRQLEITRDAVDALLIKLRNDYPEIGRERVELDLDLQGLWLHGELVSHSPGQWLRIEAGSDKPARKLIWWTEHCLMNLQQPREMHIFFGNKAGHHLLPILEREQAHEWLQRLIGLFRKAAIRPLPLFPESSWAYADGLDKKGKDEAGYKARQKMFESGEYNHAEIEDEWVGMLMRHQRELPDGFEELAEELVLPVVRGFRKPSRKKGGKS